MIMVFLHTAIFAMFSPLAALFVKVVDIMIT